jgi:taurine dioxygenase
MNTHSRLHVEPLGPVIGAVVHGVDLSKPQTDAVVADIRAALLRHQVIFFEDQHLTPVQHRDFAAKFGPLHVHPLYPQVEGVPELFVLDNHKDNPTDNDAWHTDVTFIETPPLGSLLYALELPPSGGDTMWSSMTAAYDALSPHFRVFLAAHNAVHDFMRSFSPASKVSQNAGEDRYEKARRENPPVLHPVIRTHPETGKPGIFVNYGFTTRIKDIASGESRMILKYLHEHIQRPEFIVRWRWKPGSLAFWDNRCTQHFAVNDYLPHRRVMHRATILGDKPFYRAEPVDVRA